MYEELVKWLREAAKMSEALAVLLPHSEGNAKAKLYNDAADAIEELSKRIDRAIELYNRDVEKTAIYEVLMGISPEPPKEET